MSRAASAAPVLALIAGYLILPAPVFAQQADPFVAACMRGKTATPAKCTCQSKIARANLDRGEQQAALSALRGDKDGLGKQVRALGPVKAKAFEDKLKKLGEQSRAQCR